MRFGTSPSVLLMAKPTSGAKRLLSSPQHLLNASSPARTVDNLLASYPPSSPRRNGAESRPQGGPLVQFAGWQS